MKQPVTKNVLFRELFSLTSKKQRSSPSFKGLRSASSASTNAKKASSAHTGTEPEILLRQELSALKLRFRTNVQSLPGKPDIVFTRARIAVFCDGDFWHGRNWRSRRKRLLSGTNADYWIAKIKSNMQRDKRIDKELIELGWQVIRLWESDIRLDTGNIAARLEQEVIARRKIFKKI
jgi:DNA mismatch endonuclease, patch repair protein